MMRDVIIAEKRREKQVCDIVASINGRKNIDQSLSSVVQIEQSYRRKFIEIYNYFFNHLV
jgi:hypothetical protein